MKSSDNKSILSLSFSVFLLVAFIFLGAFSITMLRRDCAKEAKAIKQLEIEIKTIKRENDFWNSQIAKIQDPSVLRKRAGDTLKITDPEKIVYAYQVNDTQNPGRSKVIASTYKKVSNKPSHTAQR